MIQSQKKIEEIPSELNRYSRIQGLLKNKQKHIYQLKKDAAPLLERLMQLYHQKCVYCELKITSFEKEHYRSQKHYPNDEKTKCEEKERHTGYYWLAYEWSNLVLSCPDCNKRKGTRFPIEEKKRVTSPSSEIEEFFKQIKNPKDWKKEETQREWNRLRQEWIAEKEPLSDENPLLLHPDFDEPDQHLRFLPNGKIEGKTERGNFTIEICQLNRATPLNLQELRKGVVDDFRKKLREAWVNFQEEFLK